MGWIVSDQWVINAMELLSPVLKTFMLVFLAEFGDKSQLVCMTLAARHRALPVVLGAVAAFALLNLLGVTFGAAVAAWLPPSLLLLGVAGLFIWFGIQAWRQGADDAGGEVAVGRHLLASVFMLIFLAEFGDKTQLAVAGLGGMEGIWWVWLGATLALTLTSVIGVLAGQWLTRRLSLRWIQRGSGSLFLLFGVLALIELWQLQ